MIPVRDIQQLILKLEIKLIELQNPEGEPPNDPYLIGYLEGVKDRVEITIGQLKELIPSENDSSRVSGNAQGTEAEQNAEQKDASRWDNFRQQTRSQLFL